MNNAKRTIGIWARLFGQLKIKKSVLLSVGLWKSGVIIAVIAPLLMVYFGHSVGIGALLAAILLVFIGRLLSLKMRAAASTGLWRYMFNKLDSLPFRYFEKNEKMQRPSEIAPAIYNKIPEMASYIAISALAFTSLVCMFVINVFAALSCSVVVAMFFCFRVMTKRRQALRENAAYQSGQAVERHVNQTYAAQSALAQFDAQAESVAELEKLDRVWLKAQSRYDYYNGMLNVFGLIMPMLSMIVAMAIAGIATIDGLLTGQELEAFFIYSIFLSLSMMWIWNHSLFEATESAVKATEFLEQPEIILDTENPKELRNVRGEIEFSKVCFGYRLGKPILDGMSWVIEPGHKAVLSGPPGSGKKTMMKLLMRLYEIDDGRILLDGQDIRYFRRRQLQKVFGVVSCDCRVQEDSFMENIRMGKRDASEKECVDAARMVGLERFIACREDGYECRISDDELSDTEKYLLSVCRSVLKKPSVYIVDAPPESMDVMIKGKIRELIEKIAENKTCVFIEQE